MNIVSDVFFFFHFYSAHLVPHLASFFHNYIMLQCNKSFSVVSNPVLLFSVFFSAFSFLSDFDSHRSRSSMFYFFPKIFAN